MKQGVIIRAGPVPPRHEGSGAARRAPGRRNDVRPETAPSRTARRGRAVSLPRVPAAGAAAPTPRALLSAPVRFSAVLFVLPLVLCTAAVVTPRLLVGSEVVRRDGEDPGRDEADLVLRLAAARPRVVPDLAVPVKEHRPAPPAVERKWVSPLRRLLDDERLFPFYVPPRRAAPVVSAKELDSVLRSSASYRPRTAVPRDRGARESLVGKVHGVIASHGKRGADVSRLSRAIVAESIRQNYDPLFVAAVIKSESGFDTIATSVVGAKGLMQIMPATGRFVAGLEAFRGPGDRSVPRGSLTDPGYNLRLGITYLRHLEEMYGGNRVLTLIAYNWGPGHVEKTMKGQKRGVPRSVMNYALKILGDHRRWTAETGARAFG